MASWLGCFLACFLHRCKFSDYACYCISLVSKIVRVVDPLDFVMDSYLANINFFFKFLFVLTFVSSIHSKDSNPSLVIDFKIILK